MRRQALLGFALTTATCLAFSSVSACAEPGVSGDKIIFGQAAALEGPASALGQEMRAGIRAAFAESNRTGGVKGRLLELISLDDGYEPNKSIEATRRLIEVRNCNRKICLATEFAGHVEQNNSLLPHQRVVR